jgi:hypothetical protein
LPKINILPFQTLDELKYQFTVLSGNNVSEKDMDKLNNLSLIININAQHNVRIDIYY